MIKRTLAGCLLGLSAAMASAADAPSPARAQMDGFIAAFNTGDRATIEAFGRDHMPPDFMRAAIIDQTLQMSGTSGGFEVLDVTETSPHALKGHVRERKTGNIVAVTIQVDATSPGRITTITLIGPDELVKSAPK